MSDEPAKFILGDTAISAIEQPGRRRFFGRKKAARRPLMHCENCGAELTGRWCSQCGQPAIDYRRSFRHVIADVLDSFLNWDSKFFATMAWLIVRPWHLTNEFLAGRRVRYLHPLRLYLLASILFFFAVNYGAKSLHLDPSKFSPKDAEIEEDLKKKNLTPIQRAKIQQALNMGNPQADGAAKTGAITERKEAAPEAGAGPGETPKKEAASDSKSYPPFLEFEKGEDATSTRFEKWLEARAKEKIGEHGTNAQLFFVTLISNLPYMMLCCIPLFAFVLKILYIRKGVFYIDHLVYALHIHTFAYIAIMLFGLITMGLNRAAAPLLAGWIIGLFWFAFAIQIFLSIRRVYRQGWFFSIFKFFAGGFVYLIVLCMALAATFFITLALP